MLRSHNWWLLFTFFVSSTAMAEKGDAALRMEYQYVRTGSFDASFGSIDIGNTDSHALMISGNYFITDKINVFASLPYIRKRHTGALPHNAVTEFSAYQPPDLRVWDTGEYHSSWQDVYFGVQYLARVGRLTIAPFVSYGLPVTNYPFYAHSAVGRNIWHMPVGISGSFTPYFSDWFFSGDIAYVFTEKSLNVDTSHWLINLRASYYLTPAFAPKVFVSIKHGTQGLAFPDDFPNCCDTENFFFHDRTVKHNWINGGIGFDWVMSERWLLSGTWFRMLEPDQVNEIERAWTLGVTRYFGAR